MILAIGMYLWQYIWSHSVCGSNRFYFLNIGPYPKSLIIKTIFVLDEWPSKSMSTNRSHIDLVQSKLFCNSIFQFLCGPEPISLVSGPGPQSWFCLCSNGFENDCNFVGSARLIIYLNNAYKLSTTCMNRSLRGINIHVRWGSSGVIL